IFTPPFYRFAGQRKTDGAWIILASALPGGPVGSQPDWLLDYDRHATGSAQTWPALPSPAKLGSSLHRQPLPPLERPPDVRSFLDLLFGPLMKCGIGGDGATRIAPEVEWPVSIAKWIMTHCDPPGCRG